MSDLFEIIDEDEFRESGTALGVAIPDAGVGGFGAAVDTYPCAFCGHCETPNKCAWSRECPICAAPAGKISMTTYCKNSVGTIVGLHAERWL